MKVEPHCIVNCTKSKTVILYKHSPTMWILIMQKEDYILHSQCFVWGRHTGKEMQAVARKTYKLWKQAVDKGEDIWN